MSIFKKNNKGSAVVETAIALPILVMIVLGFLYFTMIIKDTLVIQTASREGARHHAISHKPLEAVDVAKKELERGQVTGARIIPTFGGDYKGIEVEKDVVLSIPFTDIIVFTISRETTIHPTYRN